jgi:Flp pilus assembly protein TadG
MIMRERIIKRLVKNDQKGATAVEFAVIASILFLILFGILEFGLIFMQEHYVANAAREGMRIGVRANNYNCFNGTPSAGCTGATDRQTVVVNAVGNYLSTLYGPANILKPVAGTNDVNRDPTSLVAESKTLSVTVEVNNFFPPIISSLAALIPGTGFDLPSTISYTAEGEYEDPSEP